MARSLTPAKLGDRRRKAILAALPGSLRGLLRPRAPVTPADLHGVLERWRRLGTRGARLPTRTRLALRQRLADRFAQIFRSMSFSPEDFNTQSYRELAEVFVTMLERTGYAQIPVGELTGRRGQLAGETLELLVQNMRDLQKDFRRMSQGQRELLNEELPNLVDAHGHAPAVDLKGKFGSVRKATDIAVVDSGNIRKFIDLAYVSFFEHSSGSGPTMMSFLEEIEIRMPGKAGKAGKQIGRAQVRFHLAPGERIRMTVEGFPEPIEVGADQILFAPKSIDRVLVTVSDTPQYRPSFTARGGYPEYFWRIGVAMRADEIWRLINAITTEYRKAK
jgi:hypothetical protein